MSVNLCVGVISEFFFCSSLIAWKLNLYFVYHCTDFMICILPKFNKVKYRGLKVWVFIMAGVVDALPMLDVVFTMGFIHDVIKFTLLSCCCYLLGELRLPASTFCCITSPTPFLAGAAIYVKQVPEAWWPGKFDFFCSSHQLWHVFVFLAVLVHHKGLMELYKWRMVNVCEAGVLLSP